MLSKKAVRLLDVLLKNKNQYISSSQLAKEIGTSDRTVRKYLQQLAQEIESQGARVISKQGYGSLLEVTRPVEFEMYWQDINKQKKELVNIIHIEEASDRQHYLLNKLFFNDEHLSLENLMQELYVSKSTLTNTINDIRKLIKPYQLSLINEKDCLKIQGEEAQIRHFMMDYFFSKSLEDTMFAFAGDSLLSEINFSDITIAVLDECRDGALKLSDYVVNNLVLHIALMIRRLKDGCPIEAFPISNQLQNSKEYQVALRILYRLELAFNIKFPVEEANYIALHLNVKRTQVRLNDPQNEQENEDFEQTIVKQVKQMIEFVSDFTQCPLDQDAVLLNALTAHIHPLLVRIENNIDLQNPLLEEIYQKFPEMMDVTRQAINQVSLFRQETLSDDELAYLALHFLAAIERVTNRKKLKVLVVCATGVGSAMMLKNRLENEFGSNIKIEDVIGYYEVNEEKLHNIDLIISSISLSNLLFMTPIIHVSVFLNQEDVGKIRHYLNSKQEKLSLNYQSLTRPQRQNQSEKIVQDLFQEQRFLYFDEAISKEALLEQMIGRLQEAQSPQFVQEFTKQVGLREIYSAIVYEETLAFPHPTIPMTLTEQIVVAVCKEPIIWSDQHQKVHFIFLLSPAKGSNERMKLMSGWLVDFVNNHQLQSDLLDNPTFNQLVTIFKTIIQRSGGK